MNYYCVASDFKADVIDEYARLNQSDGRSRVSETYGQITVGNEVEAGRDCHDIPRVDLYELKEYIAYSVPAASAFTMCSTAPAWATGNLPTACGSFAVISNGCMRRACVH